MGNMLRGRFRDKLRTYVINRIKKNKNTNKETKTTNFKEKDVYLNQKNTLNYLNNNKQFRGKSKNNINIQRENNRQSRLYFNNFFKRKNGVGKSNSNEKDIKQLYKQEDVRIEILELTIINKINDIITTYKNKLDIIQSDMYILNQILSDKKNREKCEEEKKQIEQLLLKIKEIKEQYEILKSKNISMEYLGIDDGNLVDDIYKYKKLLDNSLCVDKLQDQYKKLNIFIEVNTIIDNVQNVIEKLEEENDKKLEKVGISEKDFEKIKYKMNGIEEQNINYDKFIEDSNNIIRDLSSKVSLIETQEEISYKLKGMDGLLFNNIKYISLLMLSPLKGIFPSIATSVIATKQTLDTIKQNMTLEKNVKIVYMAKDYDNFIRSNMYTVDNMKELVSDSLTDIKKIKEELKEKCQYLDSNQYKEVLRKLDVIEDSLEDNEKKLNMIDNKLYNLKRINDKKRKKIKVLND